MNPNHKEPSVIYGICIEFISKTYSNEGFKVKLWTARCTIALCIIWYDLKLQVHIFPSRNPSLIQRIIFKSSSVHSSTLLPALCTGDRCLSFFASTYCQRNKDCEVFFRSVRSPVRFAPGTTTCSIQCVWMNTDTFTQYFQNRSTEPRYRYDYSALVQM